MSFAFCSMTCVLLAASVVLQTQGTNKSAREGLVAEADFMELATSLVEGTSRAFSGRDEALLVFRRDGVPDLRVHFPLNRGKECEVSTWRVQPGAPFVYDQLLEMYEAGIAPHAAAQQLKTLQTMHVIPCDSDLAGLLSQARTFAVRMSDASIPSYGIFFDTNDVTLEVRVQDVRMRLDFPSSIDFAIAKWAENVRVSIRAYMSSGFRTP